MHQATPAKETPARETPARTIEARAGRIWPAAVITEHPVVGAEAPCVVAIWMAVTPIEAAITTISTITGTAAAMYVVPMLSVSLSSPVVPLPWRASTHWTSGWEATLRRLRAYEKIWPE